MTSLRWPVGRGPTLGDAKVGPRPTRQIAQKPFSDLSRTSKSHGTGSCLRAPPPRPCINMDWGGRGRLIVIIAIIMQALLLPSRSSYFELYGRLNLSLVTLAILSSTSFPKKANYQTLYHALLLLVSTRRLTCLGSDKYCTTTTYMTLSKWCIDVLWYIGSGNESNGQSLALAF